MVTGATATGARGPGPIGAGMRIGTGSGIMPVTGETATGIGAGMATGPGQTTNPVRGAAGQPSGPHFVQRLASAGQASVDAAGGTSTSGSLKAIQQPRNWNN